MRRGQVRRAQIGRGKRGLWASSKVGSHHNDRSHRPTPPAPTPCPGAWLRLRRERCTYRPTQQLLCSSHSTSSAARLRMIQSLQSVGLHCVIPQASYFLITDISDFSKWARPVGAGAGALEAAQD